MSIYESFSQKDFVNTKSETACLGAFDGVHLGHQKLIEETQKIDTNFQLITFDIVPKKLHVVADGEATGDEQARPFGVELHVVEDGGAVGVGDRAGEGAEQEEPAGHPGHDEGDDASADARHRHGASSGASSRPSRSAVMSAWARLPAPSLS